MKALKVSGSLEIPVVKKSQISAAGRLLAGLLVVFTLTLSACQRIGQPADGRNTLPTNTPILQVTDQPVTMQTYTVPAPHLLTIWLPPQFDPQADTLAAKILQSRLDAFSASHAGLEIQVRLKALEGPGGMMDALSTAQLAAPAALPNLVAMPRALFEAAAMQNLLTPLAAEGDQDWYPYANALSQVDGETYGVPFAGDALLLLYRSGVIDQDIPDWNAFLQVPAVLAFPAADPQSLFTLALYRAVGGAFENHEGEPSLSLESLSKVLNFYQQAMQSGRMPYWLTQFEQDDQSWQSFREHQADMVVTWSSRYFASPENVAAQPLFTAQGEPFSLVTGWVWAAPNANPLSQELVQFLTESRFLAVWTQDAGYLPPRPSSLALWTEPEIQAVASQLVLVSDPMLSIKTTDFFGPLIQPSVIDILKGQQTADEAAQGVMKTLSEP